MTLLDLPEEVLLNVLKLIPSREDLSNWSFVNRRFARLQSSLRNSLATTCLSSYDIDLRIEKTPNSYMQLTAKISTSGLTVLRAFLVFHLPGIKRATELGCSIFHQYHNNNVLTAECIYEYVGAHDFMSNTAMVRSLRQFYEVELQKAQLTLFLSQEREFIKRQDLSAGTLSRADKVFECYERQDEWSFATAVAQDVLYGHQQDMPLSAPALQLWAKRLIRCYEQVERVDEAIRLTEEIFKVMRQNMPLSAPALRPWAERLSKYDSGIGAVRWPIEYSINERLVGSMEGITRAATGRLPSSVSYSHSCVQMFET